MLRPPLEGSTVALQPAEQGTKFVNKNSNDFRQPGFIYIELTRTDCEIVVVLPLTSRSGLLGVVARRSSRRHTPADTHTVCLSLSQSLDLNNALYGGLQPLEARSLDSSYSEALAQLTLHSSLLLSL